MNREERMKNKPICYVPDREIPEVFSGVPSFLGLQPIKNDKDLEASDIVVLGVPWEGICTYGGYSSSELTTKKVREASVRYGGYLPDYDFDIFDYMTGGDFGDVAVKNGDYDFTYGQIRKDYRKILDAGKFPVVFGGDHSIANPLISEFADKYNGNIGVIHFDAHMDNMKTFGEYDDARCTPFYRLYENDNINPKNMVHFGIRGPRNNPEGMKNAKANGATVITGMEVKLNGVVESIKKAIEIASDGTDAVYVTVCSDILDVANNPGGPIDPCGLTTFELALALHECGKADKVESFDFVEIYPGQDPANVSGHVVTWMSIYFLAGVTKRKFNLK